MPKSRPTAYLLICIGILLIIGAKPSPTLATSPHGTAFWGFDFSAPPKVYSTPGWLLVTAHLDDNEVTANFTISGSSNQWQTPASVPLATGTYTVNCFYEGQQESATVSVIEGQTTSLDFDFSRLRISNPTQIPQPDRVQPLQNVIVSVNITSLGSPVKNVTLSYILNESSSWTNLTMNYNATSTLYQTVIPGQPKDMLVKYSISAYDKNGKQAVNDNGGYYFKYHVLSEINGEPMIPYLLIFGGIIIATTLVITVILLVTKRRHRKLPAIFLIYRSLFYLFH